jgi:lipopolysaccharide transport system ATP-binding protein
MTTVIQAEGLGKRYRRGVHVDAGLRHALERFVRSPLRSLRGSKPEMFWALKNASLQVREGEVVGLIGRNGAGKTTLLKILSRITRPTEGWAEIRGRVRSLLEVGTGFHPELTGRENMYLSGSILGMSKREIDRKFDEIVAFAEIEKFIETPVKHYSSGMYVRLAFSVAAHLEPEILLVDEVLAVGDIAFQRKCMGKMGDVSRAGRTIILVSHNMTAINALCSRCIVLDRGGVDFDGPTDKATARYYDESLNTNLGADLSNRRREGNGKGRFTSIAIQPMGRTGEALEAIYPGCDLRITLGVGCSDRFADSNVAVIIYDQAGFRVIDTNIAQKGRFLGMEAGDQADISFLLRDLLLRPGLYFLGLYIGRVGIETVDYLEHALAFKVLETKGDSEHPISYPGVYLCRFEENIRVRGLGL